jgi:type I restriction enzyme S subunit
MGEWKQARLRDVGVTLIDCVHKTPEAQVVGYPYVGIPQMKSGRIDFSTARLISHEDYLEWTKKAKPQKHDVILSRRTNPGVTAIDDSGTDFALGQNLVLLRADGTQVFPPFLKWMTLSPHWWEQISKFNNVGAVFDSLKCADVPNFELPIPPPDVQKSIASVLGALDDKIELNRRMNETLEAMARAIFKDWFVDFGPTRAKMEGRAPYLAPDIWSLFPDRLDDEGKPEGWSGGSLSDFAVLNPESWSRANYPERIDYVDLSNTKWGTIEAVTRFTSDAAPSRAQRILRPGDTVVGTVRPGNGSYAFVSANGLTGSTGFAVLRPTREIYREAIYLAATSKENIERLAHLADGGAYPAVRPELLAATELTAAPESVFSAFSAATSALVDRAEANKSESHTLAATRDFLLPKLMSGEICVKDAEALI